MEKIIGTVSRSATEEIRISLSEYHGQTYVQIRIWTPGKDQLGQLAMTPTSKGVSMKLEQVPEFVEIVDLLKKEVVDMLTKQVATSVAV